MEKRIIILSLTIMVILGFLIFKLIIFSLKLWNVPDEQQSSRELLQQLERDYPEKIKLLYVNVLTMHKPLSENEANNILEENLLVKERLSVNTYHLDDGYEYVNGEFIRNFNVRKNTIIKGYFMER